MKFSIYNLQFTILISYLLSLISFTPVHAAELYFGSHNKEVGLGQTFEVGVFLNTDGQIINATDGQLTVSNNLVIKEIHDGNSFINFWVERPHFVSANGGDAVVFSGIIPGGYAGRDGYLFSVILEGKKTGEATVNTTNDSVLLNDGLGTPAKLRHSPMRIKINDIGIVQAYAPEVDTTPPEAFTPVLGQDQTLFDNKWFVAFVAQDKQSGIGGYEVNESRPIFWSAPVPAETAAWQKATSPYELRDQKLRSFVYVKAIDHAGNTRIGILPPKHPLPWYENFYIWSILLLGTLLTLVTRRVLWFLKKKTGKR
jgi:hypothetical protein